MWCRSVRNQLSAYADGELSAAEARAVEEHLAGCERCSREKADLQQIARLAALIPCEEMPVGLHSRILSSLSTVDRAPVMAMRSPAFQFRMPGPHTWMMATGALALLAIGVMNRPSTTVDSTYPGTPREHPRPHSVARSAPSTVTKEPAHSKPLASVPVRVKPHTVHTPRIERPLVAHAAPKSDETAVSTVAIVSEKPARAVRAVRRGPGTVRVAGSQASVREVRPQPLPVVTPSTEPRILEPVVPVMAAQPDMIAMPGDPVMNSTAAPTTPESVAMGMEKEPAMRMAGMATEAEPTPDEDEGVRSLRMFLEERNKNIPQPPVQPSGRDRRSRKSL